MSFASALALLAALLVIGPIAAHMLRRRKTEPVRFAGTSLLQTAQPVAKQRARLDDRWLLFIRALAVIALAVLGATPFIRCSRLSMSRQGGSSIGVVLVVDDSMSMNARVADTTRFEKARRGALDVLRSCTDGDSVAVVAAGSPPRVILAASPRIEEAKRALETMKPTDRGTDLEGALSMANTIARALPQPEKRVVLLSDLADGRAEAQPLQPDDAVPLWFATPELAKQEADCGVVRADQRADQVVARVVCGAPEHAANRVAELVDSAGTVLAREPLVESRDQSVVLVFKNDQDTTKSSGLLTVKLTGSDAIKQDDSAPVAAANGKLTAVVISDITSSGIATGGGTAIEQAIEAVDDQVLLRPLPTIPDSLEDLAGVDLVFLDDPAGLTPEARTAFRTWLERGGVGVMLLGKRVNDVILGADFEPFVRGVVRWSALPAAVKGADLSPQKELITSRQSLADLAAKGRATLDFRSQDNSDMIVPWKDNQPLIFRHPISQGMAWVYTLPSSAEISDLALRPAFLELIDLIIQGAKIRGVQRRASVGVRWSIEDAKTEIIDPIGEKIVLSSGSFVADRVGLYRIKRGNEAEVRVAELQADEVRFMPRPISDSKEQNLGASKAMLDLSPHVAVVLLLVLVAEAAMRLALAKKQ